MRQKRLCLIIAVCGVLVSIACVLPWRYGSGDVLLGNAFASSRKLGWLICLLGAASAFFATLAWHARPSDASPTRVHGQFAAGAAVSLVFLAGAALLTWLNFPTMFEASTGQRPTPGLGIWVSLIASVLGVVCSLWLLTWGLNPPRTLGRRRPSEADHSDP